MRNDVPSSYNTLEPKPAFAGFLFRMGQLDGLSVLDRQGMGEHYGIGTGAGRADLADRGSEFHSVSPATVFRGQILSVAGDVANNGNDVAGGFEVQFYASVNPDISTSDFYLGARRINTVTPGSYAPIDTRIQIPTTMPEGTYYIGWILDSQFQVLETAEDDNTVVVTSQQITVPSTGATELSDRGIAYQGLSDAQRSPLQPLTISGQVANTGPANSAAFNVDFYLSTNSTITGSDYHLGRAQIQGVAQNGFGDIDTEVTIPAHVPLGTYYVGWIIDSTSDVNEMDESDNIVTMIHRRLLVSESRVDLADRDTSYQVISADTVPAGEEFLSNVPFAIWGRRPRKTSSFRFTYRPTVRSRSPIFG